MNDDRAFERATRALLEDGSDRTPAATIDAVLLAVRTTPQERDLRIPWRTAPMSNPMRLVAAIAVVVVAGVAAFNLFGSSPGVGGLSSPSPTAPPSATPTTQPSPSPIDTATWTTYVSNRYGFSIGHPPIGASIPLTTTGPLRRMRRTRRRRRRSLPGRRSPRRTIPSRSAPGRCRHARHHARGVAPGLLPAS